MTKRYRPTLRDRLIARNGGPETSKSIEVPLTGIISPPAVAAIQQLATEAKAGDNSSRDDLYESLRARLGRMGFILRPWPNTPDVTGLWDRDDVNQEGWIVFAELLEAWDGELPFVKYLFARYPWRLRDRVLRGIGKPMPPIGDVRIHEENLVNAIFAGDDEQPESAMLASILLRRILTEALGAEVTALRSPEKRKRSSKTRVPVPKVKSA